MTTLSADSGFVSERFPRHAAMKRILAFRGVPVRPDVRAPLRDLTQAEVGELTTWLGEVS